MNALTTADGADDLAKLRGLLRHDPETGRFFWLVNRRGGVKAGDLAGTVRVDGYVQIHCAGTLYLAHRLAWLFTYGRWPTRHIDHVNGNTGDNRIQNLRDVAPKLNQENQRRAHRSNRSSGLLGVSYCARTGRWLAKISIDNKTQNLGRFDTSEKAHAAYLQAKRRHHEGNIL